MFLRAVFIALLAVLSSCEESREVRNVPRATLVLANGYYVEVAQIPEGKWSTIDSPSGSDALRVEARDGTRVRIIGAPPFVVDIRELKVVESGNRADHTFIVTSPDRSRRIVLAECKNRPDFYSECQLRAFDEETEITRTESLLSYGLPVWRDNTTFFFVGSSGELFRTDCTTGTTSRLEARDRSLCAYLPVQGGLLTTDRKGIAILDPTTGKEKVWLVRTSMWSPVGDGALTSPDERYLVYSRKRLLSEVYDCYLRELKTGRESLIVPGLRFISGIWLNAG